MTNKPITKYQLFLFSFIGLLVLTGTYLFIGNSFASAQTISQQITLTYPIPELGSCRDAKECYLYCEIPRHQSVCQTYASSHPLPQVLGAQTPPREKILQAATEKGISFPIADLGNCTDVDSCRDYCHVEQNRPACKAFALRHKLVRDIKKIVFPIAELGSCANASECKNYCSQEENKPTCERFAQTHQLPFLRRLHNFLKNAREELGCTTLEECKSLCQSPNNQVSCREFGRKHLEVNRLRQNVREDLKDSRLASPSGEKVRPQNVPPNRPDVMKDRPLYSARPTPVKPSPSPTTATQ